MTSFNNYVEVNEKFTDQENKKRAEDRKSMDQPDIKGFYIFTVANKKLSKNRQVSNKKQIKKSKKGNFCEYRPNCSHFQAVSQNKQGACAQFA